MPKYMSFIGAAMAACERARVQYQECSNACFGYVTDNPHVFTLSWKNQAGVLHSHVWNVEGHTPDDFERWVYGQVSHA